MERKYSPLLVLQQLKLQLVSIFSWQNQKKGINTQSTTKPLLWKKRVDDVLCLEQNQRRLKSVRYQDEILEKYISEFDFTGRERSLITYVRLCSRSIVNVSSSDGHRNAERSFLFDFTPKCCVSGLLRTRCQFSCQILKLSFAHSLV